ncbi:thymidylate kinase [Streptomyces sp. NPDC045251]|uniref:thymidylate kinase n=1 Tax=unclassified Streptomyces TaxID=2593676 RepID=UPI00340B98B7
MGTDGAGKSTVSQRVTRHLTDQGLRIARVDRWDIVDNPAYPATRFMKPDVPDTRQCVAEMPPTTRFLFLMWSISHALLGRSAGPAPAEDITLLDGYWMKHAASEIVYGLDRQWAESVVSRLPLGETLYLRVEPAEAWERKAGRDVVPYECGMDDSCSRESFLLHQKHIQAVLDGWARRYDWQVLDATQPLDTVVDRVVSSVSSLAAGAR